MIGLLLMRRNVAYSVHEHEDARTADTPTRAEQLRFVKEGFAWPIAVLPPVALAMRGAWTALLAYLVAAFVIVSLAGVVSAPWILLLFIILGLIFAFETPAIERWRLGVAGWDEVGVVSGADLDECERRFFDAWPQQASSAPADALTAPQAGPSGLLRRLFAARP